MEEEPQSPTRGGVRRPMNAFLIFCKRHRSLVRERNPHLDNRSVTRILGELWAKLPPDEKSTYTSLANEYKEAFLKANPDYKWFNPDKNTTVNNRDKPSTRPTNSLTSYTGQVPHTDDPTFPTQGTPVTSMNMETEQGGNPFRASLMTTQGGSPFSTSITTTAQGIPLFPIGVTPQGVTLGQSLPVSTMAQAMTTLAMVGGQPMVVTQTPVVVSLPQQQLPITMVTTNCNGNLTTITAGHATITTGGLTVTNGNHTVANANQTVANGNSIGNQNINNNTFDTSNNIGNTTATSGNQGNNQIISTSTVAFGNPTALGNLNISPGNPTALGKLHVATGNPTTPGNPTMVTSNNLVISTPKIDTMAKRKVDPHVALFELAKMCTTELGKAPTQSVNITSQISQPPPTTTNGNRVPSNWSHDNSTWPKDCVTNSPQHNPPLDSTTILQGQVKEALGFHIDDAKATQHQTGANQVLDFSAKNNKEAEMKNVLRQDAAKMFSIDHVAEKSKYHKNDLSKLVLDSVIEAMYSREAVRPATASSLSSPVKNQEPAESRRLMLTFGEIQERVIRSAVEQSDELLRRSESFQADIKVKQKPATITCDPNKENKGDTKNESCTDPPADTTDCDVNKSIPVKKRRPRKDKTETVANPNTHDDKIPTDRIPTDKTTTDKLPTDKTTTDKVPEDRTPDDTQSSADDLDPDNDIDLGLRKSKRSNRGQRYQQLIQQGYLQTGREKPSRKSEDTTHSQTAAETSQFSTPVEPTTEMATQQYSHPEKDDEHSLVEQNNQDHHGDYSGISNRSNSISLGTSSEIQQHYSRKRTFSETDISHRRMRKKYKTGDFDLEAHIASLPVCQIEEVSRRGYKVKGLKVRHHSENSTLNKFAKPVDINLLNVAELRGVLRPRSQSLSHASGSARRKAPKMSIVRFIQAIRNPHASTVPLLSPVSASGIPPWNEWPTKADTVLDNDSKSANNDSSTINNIESKKMSAATEMKMMHKLPNFKNDIRNPSNASPEEGSTTSQTLQGSLCVNVTSITDINNVNRFETNADKGPSLVTCK